MDMAVGATFSSWKEFQAALDAYSKRTFTIWTTQTTRSVETANKRLKRPPFYKSELVYAYAKLSCKHQGSMKSFSTGQRPEQRTFRSNCPAYVYITSAEGDKSTLRVTQIVDAHNHDCSAENYKLYPEARRIPAVLQKEVTTMMDLGATADNVRVYLQEHNVYVLNRDIYNLLQKQKKAKTSGGDEDVQQAIEDLRTGNPSASVHLKKQEETGVTTDNVRVHLQEQDVHLTNKDMYNLQQKQKKAKTSGDDEDVQQVLENLRTSNPTASVHLKKQEETGVLEVFYIQTGHMRESAQKFGEVLIIDGTYGINNRKIPLYTILGHGGGGKGVVLAHALVMQETKENLSFVWNKYKDSTDIVPTCVVMDKDCCEIDTARASFPDAQVILCACHTLRTFKKKTSTITDAKVKEAVQELLIRMVQSSNEDAYQKAKEELEEVAPRTFMDYFTKNWAHCTETWASYHLSKLPHLGKTTNRIESLHQKMKHVLIIENLHQKMKHVLKKEMTVAECIKGLLHMHKTTIQGEVNKRTLTRTCTFYNTKGLTQDESLVIKNLESAEACQLQEKYETTTESCKCVAFTTKQLPCKHILRKRKDQGLPMFDLALVDQHWHTGEDITPAMPGTVSVTASQKLKTLTKVQKYKDSMCLMKQLADIMSKQGMDRYRHMYLQLEHIRDCWRTGDLDVLDGSDQETPVDDHVEPEEDMEVDMADSPFDLRTFSESSSASDKDAAAAQGPTDAAPVHPPQERADFSSVFFVQPHFLEDRIGTQPDKSSYKPCP